MKELRDAVAGWLRKAYSDLLALDASAEVGALDAACFHAQQSAEKHLKAYLVYADIEFPFTHNLTRLAEICAGQDESFRELIAVAEPLTPFAVEARYDSDFWPSEEDTAQARTSALKVRQFIFDRLPYEITRLVGG